MYLRILGTGVSGNSARDSEAAHIDDGDSTPQSAFRKWFGNVQDHVSDVAFVTAACEAVIEDDYR